VAGVEERYSAQFELILRAFDAAAAEWSALVTADPTVAVAVDPGHLAAVPEKYLDLRYHLICLAGGRGDPAVSPIAIAAETPGPATCLTCGALLSAVPLQGAQELAGVFWDPGVTSAVVAVACASCGRLWSVKRDLCRNTDTLAKPPRPQHTWWDRWFR
jgi:hypothetical protein